MTDSTWSRRGFLQQTVAGLGGVVAVGAGAGLLSGCSKTGQGGTLQQAKKSGTIKVGVAGEKPYGYTEKGGKVTGEAPAIARVVFGKLGIHKLEASEVSFSALISALRNETFDVIAAGMFITPDRCKQILFSNPDYAAQEAFLVRKDGPAANATSFKDIAANPNIKLGTLGKGAVEYGYATDSGVKESQIHPIEEQADGYQQLLQGRIDAFALTRASLQTQLDDNPSPKLKLSKPFFPVINGEAQKGYGGFGFRKGDADLRDAFNRELKKLQDADRVYDIVKPFGFTKGEIHAANGVKAKELCHASM